VLVLVQYYYFLKKYSYLYFLIVKVFPGIIKYVTLEIPINIYLSINLRGCSYPTMIIRLVGNLGYTVNLFFIDLVLLILALSLLILSIFTY